MVAREQSLAAQGEKISYSTQQRSRLSKAMHGTSRPITNAHNKTNEATAAVRKQLIALHDNDGRSPDSNTQLRAAVKKKEKSLRFTSQELVDGLRFQEKIITYQSTPWDNNSCYLDVMIESLYYIYIRNKARWDLLISELHTDHAEESLGLMLFLGVSSRYLAYGSAETITVLSDSLAIIRNNIRERLISEGLVAEDSYESAVELLIQILDRSEFALSSIFFTSSIRYQKCGEGHVLHLPDTARQTIILPLQEQAHPNESQSIEAFVLKKINPLMKSEEDNIRIDSVATGERQLQCSFTPCQSTYQRYSVPMSLPEVLLIEEQATPRSSKRDFLKYFFPNEIGIFKGKKYDRLKYTLISRIEFSAESQHYVSLHNPKTHRTIYKYDSMNAGGTAVPLTKGSKKDAIQEFCASRPGISSAWYILECADEAQAAYIESVKLFYTSRQQVLSFNKDENRWRLTPMIIADIDSSDGAASETSSLPITTVQKQPRGSAGKIRKKRKKKKASHVVSAQSKKRPPTVKRKRESSLDSTSSLQSADRLLEKTVLVKERIKPSMERILVHKDQPADKEFVVNLDLPKRRRLKFEG